MKEVDFDSLYRAYKRDPEKLTDLCVAIRAHAMKRSRSEDVAQSVIVAVLEALPQYEDRGMFAHWMNKIVTSKIADAGRASMNTDQHDPDAPPTAHPAEHEFAPFDGLNENERRLCDLVMEGHSLKEIALILGITYSAVQQRMYRLRNK